MLHTFTIVFIAIALLLLGVKFFKLGYESYLHRMTYQIAANFILAGCAAAGAWILLTGL